MTTDISDLTDANQVYQEFENERFSFELMRYRELSLALLPITWVLNATQVANLCFSLIPYCASLLKISNS